MSSIVVALVSLSVNLRHVSSAVLNCVPVVMAGYDVVYYHLHQNSQCAAKLGKSRYSYNLDSADFNGTLRTYQFWFSSQNNLDLFTYVSFNTFNYHSVNALLFTFTKTY